MSGLVWSGLVGSGRVVLVEFGLKHAERGVWRGEVDNSFMTAYEERVRRRLKKSQPTPRENDDNTPPPTFPASSDSTV